MNKDQFYLDKYIHFKRDLILKITNNETDKVDYSIEKNIEKLNEIFNYLSFDDLKKLEQQAEMLEEKIYVLTKDNYIFEINDYLKFLEIDIENEIKELLNFYKEDEFKDEFYILYINEIVKENGSLLVDFYEFNYLERNYFIDTDKKVIIKKGEIK